MTHAIGIERALEVGMRVEKFTGEARWFGVIVSEYLTTRGGRRFVVEVEPQGFQMIAVPSQLQLAPALSGKAVATFLANEADLRDMAPDDHDENVTANMRAGSALITTLVAENERLPKFEGIAKRKLDDLLARGWEISGYAIHKDGEHGLVTDGGFVGWFTTAERNATTLERQLATAREALEPFAALIHRLPMAADHVEIAALNGDLCEQYVDECLSLTVGDFRKALRALTPGVSDAE